MFGTNLEPTTKMDGVEPYPWAFPTPMPPFLSKTYDMVEDASTDDIIEWGPQNNSFVVKDQSEFSRVLLPKYFKHGNFTSFVRQLNVYGFRKINHDKWEFANEGFLRGQKHLLKHITRRKPSHTQTRSQPHSQNSTSRSTSFVELGNFGFNEEIERLKRDNDVLMQELVKLRQQQEDSKNQLQTMAKRVNGIENHQKKIMSFLAKGMRRTNIFAPISGLNKKRRLAKQDEEEEEAIAVQLIKFQTAVESVDNGVAISKVPNESMLSDISVASDMPFEKYLSVNQVEETEKMSAIMDSLFDDSIHV